MSSHDQELVDQYINHSTAPLGANTDGTAPGQNLYEPATVTGSNGELSDSTRYGAQPKDGLPSMNQLSPEAEEAVQQILFPSDIFTQDGTYWADLPFSERWKFCNHQSNSEARRELGIIWRMFKSDPLSPISAYFSTYVSNGMGMFVEGYTLFSVGNVKPLLQNTWPRCWDYANYQKKIPPGQTVLPTECDKNWINAIDYLEIIGIIIGQILVGIEGDWVGRRFGMVQDALVMTLGSVMLTCMWGVNFNGWVICYAWSLFIYGIGVGGEYPMTSTRAMEGSGDRYATSTGDRMHRGRNVLLAFLMQGWGQLFNQAILIILLFIFHNNLQPPFKPNSTQFTFRISFAFIAAVTLYLVYYRYYKISYSEHSLKEAKERLNTSGYDLKSLKLAFSHYWHRLLASCFGWFANDFFFYGNKIFSGVFISLITGGDGKLQVTWLYNLINVGVQLPGYYLAAILVDNKMYGRKWMQANGFMATFALFVGAAFGYKSLTNGSSANLKWFQFIFFFSSFWNQFGYNSTTFLVAAEIFPASIRATCHGFSAAWGKLGALVPTIVYNYVNGSGSMDANQEKFMIVTWFGLAGWIVTLIFLPDTTGLDLREQERYWEFVMAGRPEDYHGVAVNPRHLSLFERVVLKRHLAYNPQLDAEQKMEEFRSTYQSAMLKADGNEQDLTLQQHEFLNSEFGNKFIREAKLISRDNERHASRLDSIEKRL
ncbi:hypothetical protein MVES1_001956 [Malassezia vespertilionis]|uniref:Major facilitator superfamily (MFS) profile domain-containing protein n=1 Tax=Malassezia vespertilionis TaxID=2020962 RepID=A0A2N1JDC6_9BASI|nr:uncharacterized protein MVES1_001956 [Malassezia vespertilionis]PKI84522.1 hypothetical protein MVES_001851 [Malassezia vespertilionis]WFD06603.1 hypothetical protein MVES1_001956 [Malassezia vespertilionis]